MSTPRESPILFRGPMVRAIMVGVDRSLPEAAMKQPEITEVVPGVFQCGDCGAHADAADKVEHYPNCEPRSSERWAKHYNEKCPHGVLLTQDCEACDIGDVDDDELHLPLRYDQ